MPNAIHRTTKGDTLETIAEQYYALRRPNGERNDVALKKITNAIRAATSKSALAHAAKDSDTLPEASTLFVPTLGELNRAVFAANAAVLRDLQNKGFDHARKMLRFSAEQVIDALSPVPPSYTQADVRRTWTLTAFLSLDGMDRYTAAHLYQSEGITSLPELAAQSEATLDAILLKLTFPPHDRPAELLTQGHALRWRTAAKVLVRGRLGELSKIRGRFSQTPLSSSAAAAQAEFYQAARHDGSHTPEDAKLAGLLARLHRFQAALLRGNVGVRSGNWGEAVAGLQEARRQWHRLSEETGASAAVSDDAGLNLRTCIETSRLLLELLPSDDDAPLDAPKLSLQRESGRRDFRLRGFRESELNPSGRQQLREALAAVPVHRMPARVRAAAHAAVLTKTRSQLRAADPALVTGLVNGADTALARDFERQDRDVLRRNLGAIVVGKLYAGDTSLGVFDGISGSLAISDIEHLVPKLWRAAAGVTPRRAADVLSDESAAAYPPGFLARGDVSPFTKFVELPGESGHASRRYVPLTSAFAKDYEAELLQPRVTSDSSEDLLFDEQAWASAGAFAAIAPYLYCSQIPLGLLTAYGRQGQLEQARRFGGVRLNLYGSGSLVRDVGSVEVSSTIFDPDLFACSTAWNGDYIGVLALWEVSTYAKSQIGVADYNYRRDDRALARSLYADVMCAIEKVCPQFADETRLALTGVYNTITAINNRAVLEPAQRKLQNLSTFLVTYVDNGTTFRVMEDSFLLVREPVPFERSLSSSAQTIKQYFEWNGVIDIETGDTKTGAEVVDEYLDSESSGSPAEPTDDGLQVYPNHAVSNTVVDNFLPDLYSPYLYCSSKMAAIDAGLNWYGYPDEYVPVWSFDHLYGVARDLCNRALEAEQRVFSLLQMYESAQEKEFLATQAEAMGAQQLAVAKAKVEQQAAANLVAAKQAQYTVEQADAQADKSAAAAWVAGAVTVVGVAVAAVAATVVTGGAAGAALAGSVAVAGGSTAVGALASFAQNISGHADDMEVLGAAEEVAVATMLASITALNVAIAERDVAALESSNTAEYVDFLSSLTLNSDGYLVLLTLARDIVEIYIHHANRLAWLAERALENETRQAYNLVATDYTINDELVDMTRAQQLTSDLEALRSEYVAGATSRLQEIKWTVSLSLLDPIAWVDLRETGVCTFVLRQRSLDLFFPGMYQHRLKDIRVEVVGLVPPDGVRGTLTHSGCSWVRVPNEEVFLAEQTKTDWPTRELAGSTDFPPYDQYVLKRLVTTPSVLSLSQFDVRSDRAVLSSPQGMLKAVEHHGLDAGWTLKLHRQSNDFDFRNIVDAEFTFWFLCAYDPDLEQAQANALVEQGRNGKLTGAARVAFLVHQPDAWSAFTGDAQDPEALDVRTLPWNVTNLPLWEKERKLTNLLVACAGAAEQGEITLRLLCDRDPAGVAFTTSGGAAYTVIGVDTSSETPPPSPHRAVQAWVKKTFYSVGAPAVDPKMRWVIKASSLEAGAQWLAKDEDGSDVTTGWGPLNGFAGGSGVHNDGAAWTNVLFKIKVAHRSATLRLHLRKSGDSSYALEVSSSEVRLLRIDSGVATQLDSALALSFPPGEYLAFEFQVVGQSLSASVDGIALFTGIDGAPSPGQLKRGSVAIEVVSGSRPAAFDDAEVVRLTGLGLQAERLLQEPFTASMPSDWTFADGDQPWAIAAQGHPLLDLSKLRNVVLSLDYSFEPELN